ncbi:hypothetical protein E4T56_gene4260, partial [Termitomyces sp. T112]
EFVRTARASGLSPTTVIVTYAFRNAMLPVITTLSMVFSFLLRANVLVEKVFAWPGIGSYAVEALISSDFAPVQGFVLTMAVMVGERVSSLARPPKRREPSPGAARRPLPQAGEVRELAAPAAFGIRKPALAARTAEGRSDSCHPPDPQFPAVDPQRAVGRRDDQPATTEMLPHQAGEHVLAGHVERIGRLVQQQQARSVFGLAAGELHQDAGEMGALLFAAGQRRHVSLAEMRQSHFVQCSVDQRVRFARVAIARAQQHDLRDREGEADIDVLGQDRAPGGELARRIAADIALFQQDLA